MISKEELMLLNYFPGFGLQTINKIINSVDFKSYVSLEDIMNDQEIKQPPSSEVWERINQKIVNIKNQCETHDIGIVSYFDDYYPPFLKLIEDPPMILYYKGNKDLLSHNNNIAIVGSRKASYRGLRSAELIARQFVQNDFTIISGLAKGCDYKAHLGALNANGHTIAILAHGLDMIYPQSHITLARKILENGGLLISEYEPGVKPFKNQYVRRNRLQSGMSKGVVVVETGMTGGTMHTANFCINQNRLLATIIYEQETPPGNLELISIFSGTHKIEDEGDIEEFTRKLNKFNIQNFEMHLKVERQSTLDEFFLYTLKQL